VALHDVTRAVLSNVLCRCLAFFAKFFAIIARTTFCNFVLLNGLERADYVAAVQVVLAADFSLAEKFGDCFTLGARNEFSRAALALRAVALGLVPLSYTILTIKCSLAIIAIGWYPRREK